MPFSSNREALEKIYGPSSAEGWGSAVFAGMAKEGEALAATAQKLYQQFLGEKAKSNFDSVWMPAFKQVLVRNGAGKVLEDLTKIEDPDAKNSVGLLTDAVEDSAGAQQALSSAYDNADLLEVGAFTIGDGEAMSGIILLGSFVDNQYMAVIALMD